MRSVIAKLTMTAVALAATSTLFLPATAVAAEPEAVDRQWAKLHDLTGHSRECVDNAYVKGCVQDYGDYFWLRDDEWDGIDVRLWWVDNDGTKGGLCQSDHGYGDWARCKWNLPEGHEIKWATSWYADGEWQLSKYQHTRI